MPHNEQKKACHNAQKRIEHATKELDESAKEVEQANEEVRHGARNISQLMHALADRMGRRHASG